MWHSTTINQVLGDVSMALLTGWDSPDPETLLALTQETQRLQAILTHLLGGKELVWYFSEAHNTPPPPELESEEDGTCVCKYIVYDSWMLDLPLHNTIEISKCRSIIALSLCGCSGQSALTEYIKIIGDE